MKKNQLLFFTILIAITLTLTGCMMTTKYHISESPILQTDNHDGIEVQCLYLDREAITKRHGLKSNPFLAPTMIATPHPAIIFELTIKNLEEAPLKLDIRDIEFYFSDKRFRAMSKVQIEDQIDDYATNGFDKTKQKRVAKSYMLGDIKIIPGNSEVKGYLVFMKNFKDRGEGELILPFKTPDGYEAGDFSFSYNFIISK